MLACGWRHGGKCQQHNIIFIFVTVTSKILWHESYVVRQKRVKEFLLYAWSALWLTLLHFLGQTLQLWNFAAHYVWSTQVKWPYSQEAHLVCSAGFSWIIIGQTRQLILSANHNPSESSWTDQKHASSLEGHFTCLDQT